jgi:putative SOS response-associated peptidase YedK
MENQNLDELVELLKPYPSELMEAYAVDRRVGNPKNNDKGLIKKKSSLESFI